MALEKGRGGWVAFAKGGDSNPPHDHSHHTLIVGIDFNLSYSSPPSPLVRASTMGMSVDEACDFASHALLPRSEGNYDINPRWVDEEDGLV